MSVKLMSQVWERDLPHREQSVLLVCADHANDDGTGCYPSVDRIAWKTGYSVSAVRAIIRSLRAAEVLVVAEAGGGRKATEYTVDLSKTAAKKDYEDWRVEKGRHRPNDRPAGGDAERGQNEPSQNRDGTAERGQNRPSGGSQLQTLWGFAAADPQPSFNRPVTILDSRAREGEEDDGEEQIRVPSLPRFPLTKDDTHKTWTQTVLAWAFANQDPPPRDDKLAQARFVLDRLREWVSPDHPSWKRLVPQVARDLVHRVTGEPMPPSAVTHTERLIRKHGVAQVLNALYEAAGTAGIDDRYAADPRAVTKYAEAVLKGEPRPADIPAVPRPAAERSAR